MKVSTNWLKEYVTLAPPLERIADKLTLAGLEVKKVEPRPDLKDTLFEIEITTNRADWLSHIGVAREIGAVENLTVKYPPADKTQNRPMPPGWKIHLRDPEGCSYYTGVYLEGVPNAETPDFIRERLQACAIRSINIIVDITNYVLLETGQPLHAFDADTVKGQEVQIRRAKPGEKFRAINGAELILEPTDLVIADQERPVALAGIMGGKDSEVTERTRNIFLESASFLPRLVRHTSKRTGISSDSSYRFERRVDPEGVDFGRDRAIALILQYAKPRFVSGVMRAGQKTTGGPKGSIHLSMSEVDKKLGVKIKQHQVISILTRLGLDAKGDSADSIKVLVPSFRPDLAKPIDLIEEVARIFGYENIPETLPSRPPQEIPRNEMLELENKMRRNLTGQGFFETVTFSLISGHGWNEEGDVKGSVRVNNPLNQDLKWMRPFLLPSLLPVVERNLNFGAQTINLFEIAHVYSIDPASKQIQQQKVLAVMMAGKCRVKNWLDAEREASFYDLKGTLESLLLAAGIEEFRFTPSDEKFLAVPASEKIFIRGESVGYVGEVQPVIAAKWNVESRVFYAELVINSLIGALKRKKVYREVPRYPSILRDLSVIVPLNVKASHIRDEILSLGQGLIASVEVFDMFQGGRIPKGHKSLGFRVIYQSRERTLVSDEVQKLHFSIADLIVSKYQATFQQ